MCVYAHLCVHMRALTCTGTAQGIRASLTWSVWGKALFLRSPEVITGRRLSCLPGVSWWVQHALWPVPAAPCTKLTFKSVPRDHWDARACKYKNLGIIFYFLTSELHAINHSFHTDVYCSCIYQYSYSPSVGLITKTHRTCRICLSL